MEDKNFRRRLLSSCQDPIRLPAGYKRLEYIECNSDTYMSLETLWHSIIFTSKGYGPDFEIKIGHNEEHNYATEDYTANSSTIDLCLAKNSNSIITDRINIDPDDFTSAEYVGNNVYSFKLNYDVNSTATLKCQDDRVLVNNNTIISTNFNTIIKRDVSKNLVGKEFDSFSLGGKLCKYMRFYYFYYIDDNGKKHYIVPAYNPKNESYHDNGYQHVCLYDTYGVTTEMNGPDSNYIYKFINRGGDNS